MATLDDRLLGEKTHYYCSSSSEDEADDDTETEREESSSKASGAKFIPESELQGHPGGVSTNTGPKGVIEDWRRYKQLEKEDRTEKEQEKMALAKKLALTCRSDREDQEAKAKEEDLDNLLDDDMLAEFIQKRMQEMMSFRNSKKKFGNVITLVDGNQFLTAIDEEAKDVVIIILIYQSGNPPCEKLRKSFQTLSKSYDSVKFCSIKGTSAGLSKLFNSEGVPAILVYKGGDLISNFVRVTDNLGDDFFDSDVESFLVEHGVLADKELIPTIIRGPEDQSDESD